MEFFSHFIFFSNIFIKIYQSKIFLSETEICLIVAEKKEFKETQNSNFILQRADVIDPCRKTAPKDTFNG